MLNLKINELVKEVYDEIVTLPFYKKDETYRYSNHLLTGEGSNSKYLEFLDRDPESITYPSRISYKEYLKFFNESISKLENIVISQEEYESWLFNQDESKTIKHYKDVVHGIHGELNRLAYIEMIGDYFPEVEESQAFDKVLSYRDQISHGEQTSSLLVDLDETTDSDYASNNRSGGKRVLNKNNPFADVSIEDQKFLYATDGGSFKVLELNTSYTLTRIQKDDVKSFLALQPGFKIRISSNLAGENASDIVFDDTLTTEIAQDDKVYVYLDGLQE